MKKNIYILSFALIIMVTAISAITNAGGSPGAKTGSPADVNSCTQCHAGTAVAVNSWITTNIPATGYVPGNTYTITLTGTHSGVSRFGFELTAEDSLNNKVGVFTITNTAETKLANSNHAVTHTGNGLTPTNDSKSWSFDWTAPAANTGSVTFYAALNAADGNMGTSGDIIYTTNSTVIEGSGVGINNVLKNNLVNLYPSTVEQIVNLEWNNITVEQLVIYNISGQVIRKQVVNSNQNSIKLDVSNMAKGSYFVYLQTGDDIVLKRFIKK